MDGRRALPSSTIKANLYRGVRDRHIRSPGYLALAWHENALVVASSHSFTTTTVPSKPGPYALSPLTSIESDVGRVHFSLQSLLDAQRLDPSSLSLEPVVVLPFLAGLVGFAIESISQF